MNKHLARIILINTINEYNTLTLNNNGGRKRKLSIDYIVDRIFHVLRTGCQWRHLEVDGGSWKTVYHYFSVWSKENLFEKSYEHLLNLYSRNGISKKLIVDTSFVKNVFGRNCTGPSPFDRGRRATKVSALTDSSGIPLCFTFHPGNKNDSRTLFKTLRSSKVSLSNKVLYADKIYDTSHCRSVISSFNMTSAVSQKGKTTSITDNRVRIVVEHTFSWLDKFRRILVRYEGLISHLRSFHYLAASQICATRLAI